MIVCVLGKHRDDSSSWASLQEVGWSPSGPGPGVGMPCRDGPQKGPGAEVSREVFPAAQGLQHVWCHNPPASGA